MLGGGGSEEAPPRVIQAGCVVLGLGLPSLEVSALTLGRGLGV